MIRIVFKPVRAPVVAREGLYAALFDLEEHNKAHPDDRRPLYDLNGDDLIVLNFVVPDEWTPERAAVKPVPQPRSCANCALRMVEHDLERRTQLGCFVHPDDKIYNAGARICECWTGRN